MYDAYLYKYILYINIYSTVSSYIRKISCRVPCRVVQILNLLVRTYVVDCTHIDIHNPNPCTISIWMYLCEIKARADDGTSVCRAVGNGRAFGGAAYYI